MVIARCEDCDVVVAAIDFVKKPPAMIELEVQAAAASLDDLEAELDRRTDWGDGIWTKVSKLEVGPDDILVFQVPRDTTRESMMDLHDHLQAKVKPMCRGVWVFVEGTEVWTITAQQLAGYGFVAAPRAPQPVAGVSAPDDFLDEGDGP